MIKIGRGFFNFILEPVVDNSIGEVIGYEILCRSCDSPVDNEVFFRNLAIEELKKVFFAQIDYFLQALIENKITANQLFVNAPVALLLDDEIICSLARVKKNIGG